MDKRRLLKLADLLDRVQEQKAAAFNIGSWFESGVGVFESDAPLSTEAVLGRCGTTACAMGFAATLPEFQQAGLRSVLHGHGGSVFYDTPDGRWYCGVEAAEMFFQLPYLMAFDLFMPAGYTDAAIPCHPTAKEVADRIRQVVRGEQPVIKST